MNFTDVMSLLDNMSLLMYIIFIIMGISMIIWRIRFNKSIRNLDREFEEIEIEEFEREMDEFDREERIEKAIENRVEELLAEKME